MPPKTPKEPKKLVAWECPKCHTKLHPVQMELQPKVCTSCGKADLTPVYE